MNRRAVITIVAVIGAHLVLAIWVELLRVYDLNATLTSWGSTMPWALVCVFLLLAQCLLLSIGAAFGSGRAIVRLPGLLLMVVMLWSVRLAANRFIVERLPLDFASLLGTSKEEALISAIGMLVAVVVMFIPLWGLRWFTGWNIALPDSPARVDQPRQSFRIAHILVCLTLIAAALGVARLNLPGGVSPVDMPAPQVLFKVMGWRLLACLVFAGICSPLIWLAFQPVRNLVIGLGVWWAVVTLLLIALAAIMITITGGDVRQAFLEFSIWAYIMLPLLATGVTITTTLATLSWAGFRLERNAEANS